VQQKLKLQKGPSLSVSFLFILRVDKLFYHAFLSMKIQKQPLIEAKKIIFFKGSDVDLQYT
jgi:hypothetical protein